MKFKLFAFILSILNFLSLMIFLSVLFFEHKLDSYGTFYCLNSNLLYFIIITIAINIAFLYIRYINDND
jgi:hypothetical protein